MVKLPPLLHKVVQTSSETTCEGHVRSAVDECEKNTSTSLLVCVRSLWLVVLCVCCTEAKTGSKITDGSRLLAFQLGRRDLLAAGGTTLGAAALWGSFYQRLQVDEASYDERKTRLFECLDSVPFAEVLEVNHAAFASTLSNYCCDLK
jgi:hypothetical protein